MKAALVPALAMLTACAGQPAQVNPFDAQADFAAQRELETTVIENMDGEVACVHVTEVLMDLDCELKEINSALGLVSGISATRLIAPQRMLPMGTYWRSCGGSNVTVAVKERDENVVIRASFEPAKPEADQAFKTLLRRSIAEQPEK